MKKKTIKVNKKLIRMAKAMKLVKKYVTMKKKFEHRSKVA